MAYKFNIAEYDLPRIAIESLAFFKKDIYS